MSDEYHPRGHVVGKWNIVMRGPSPCWLDITYTTHGKENRIATIHHRDLPDLQYALDRAAKEVASRIK